MRQRPRASDRTVRALFGQIRCQNRKPGRWRMSDVNASAAQNIGPKSTYTFRINPMSKQRARLMAHERCECVSGLAHRTEKCVHFSDRSDAGAKGWNGA